MLFVMPGISVVYLGPVLEDGEGLDVIKERFIATPAVRALADAQAITRQTGGRILKWMRDAPEPDLWISADQNAQATGRLPTSAISTPTAPVVTCYRRAGQ